jgi:MoaA/NifB/PqqE/SkfB family radical SAM enzyme
MSRTLTLSEMGIGGYKFFRYLLRGGLLNANLEVTKRCNARCEFCDYWKEKPPRELADYVPVIKKLKPLSVGITGGEPLLRKDLEGIVSSLRSNFGFLHIGLITNGALLTSERGFSLWEAGLDELSISLDYLDERHDSERRIPGLTKHIFSVVPRLTAHGVKVCFNIVIKSGNYRELPRMVSKIAEMGIRVSLSTYNCWRIDNETHMIGKEDLLGLKGTIGELKALRRKLGNLVTGDYYLERVPEFFEKRGVSGCTAGLNWVQVTPDGMIKRCSDQPVSCSYDHWQKGLFKPTDCDRCWYSCRGAAQEPMNLKRFLGMARNALS